MPDGPGGFTQDSSCPALLRILQTTMILACKGLSPATARLSNLVPVHITDDIEQSYYPAHAKIHVRFGLFRFRSPLLTESLLFSLPGGTKMFQFPPFAFPIREWCLFKAPGCPIRTPPDQWLFAPTRGFSQLTASFIASLSQGIHRPPLTSFFVITLYILG